MSANGFREDELVSRRVNGETRVFPIVGGRLRLAHEGNKSLSLETELVSWEGDFAVFKCCASTERGRFVGYGTANAQRDVRLAESLIELAETRSIARALRFSGYGMEFCGAEEVSHVDGGVSDREQRSEKAGPRLFKQRDARGKEAAKAQGGGNGQATQAQIRALYALTKRAGCSDRDIEEMLAGHDARSFDELSRQDASSLISHLQSEAA